MTGSSVPYPRENWKVEIEQGDVYIMGDDNRSVAYVGRVDDIRVRRANLIAKAPDLLIALECLLACRRESPQWNICAECIEGAVVALARAKGE